MESAFAHYITEYSEPVSAIGAKSKSESHYEMSFLFSFTNWMQQGLLFY